MTEREHFQHVARQDVKVAPTTIEPGPLVPTWERWRDEGLNPALDPHDYDEWCEAFGFDHWATSVSVSRPKPPLYKKEILEETDTTYTMRREDGSIIQEMKGEHKSIYHELRPAITSKEEWERFKKWLDVEAPLPQGNEPWVQNAFAKARQLRTPVWLSAGSLMGKIRNWLGFEEFAMKPFDDREWIEDMFETCCRAAEWQVRAFGKNGVPLDVVHFWEDICFKNGPIIHPDVFEEMVVPRYRRIADLAAGYGYDFVSVDSDGNLWALLSGWLKGGINVINPLEVQAGMDVNQIQDEYGTDFLLMGGIHKHKLTGGEAAIVEELRRVKPAVERGRYIPCLDHNVPHDVSLQNYLCYCRLKPEILELETPAFDSNAVLA
ncbi:MAG: hypothetical protein K9N51_00885 [Candidatus Pacebacteria bacterium]|nr:hypothetical protein [Candidatus Paceibacterota bacterium]